MAWNQDHLPILKRNRLHLVKTLDLKDSTLWDALVTNEVVSQTQADNIQGRHASNHKQASALVTHLEKRPTSDFMGFIESLKEADHEMLASYLEEQMGGGKSKTKQIGGDQSKTSPEDIAEGVSDVQLGNVPNCPPDFYRLNRHKSYDLVGKDKGRALIVNMSEDRTGSAVDKGNMADLFRDLGYSVETIDDPSFLALDTALEAFARSEKNVNAKSVFVVLMAHGGMDGRKDLYIKASDNSRYKFQERIEDIFSTANAPHLVNKPKVFIVQACMGKMIDAGTLAKTFGPSIQVTDTDDPRVERQDSIVPSFIDYLFAFATRPQHKAVRDTRDGSMFLNEINAVFRQEAATSHVVDMLTTVRNNVASKTAKAAEEKERLKTDADGQKPGVQFVQTTHNHDYLTKRFFIFPGIC